MSLHHSIVTPLAGWNKTAKCDYAEIPETEEVALQAVTHTIDFKHPGSFVGHAWPVGCEVTGEDLGGNYAED